MTTTNITNKSGVSISAEQVARFIETEVRNDFSQDELNEIETWGNLTDIVDVNEYLSRAVAFFRIDMSNQATIHDTFAFLNDVMRITNFIVFKTYL